MASLSCCIFTIFGFKTKTLHQFSALGNSALIKEIDAIVCGAAFMRISGIGFEIVRTQRHLGYAHKGFSFGEPLYWLCLVGEGYPRVC